MRFIYQGKNGCCKELTDEELCQHLTASQVREAIEAKQADPYEEVSYMAVGGVIIAEL